MGLRRLRSGRRFALRFTLVGAALALALSGGALPRAEAATTTGVVYLTFGGDTRPTSGVLCKGKSYKVLVQPVWITGKVRRQAEAHIEVETALNPITPSSIDQGAHNGAAIFYYNAKDTGTETITATATQNLTFLDGTPMTGSGFAHPPIGVAKLQFEVKECTYKVSLVYSLKASIANVIAYMGETELTSNPDGTLEGDGSFDFQQTVYGTGCGTQFTAFSVPTHITGTVKPITSVAGDPNAGLNLKFAYGAAETTFSAVCPIAGKGSASHNIDVATLGVLGARVPQGGGYQLFNPKLGGKFVVMVTQEVK